MIGFTNESPRFYLQNCRKIKTILILITNPNKFLSLAYRGKNGGVVFDKFDANLMQIIKFNIILWKKIHANAKNIQMLQ